MQKGSTHNTHKQDANQHTHTRSLKIRKLEAQHIQTHARYKTKTSKGASNFQCKQFKYKLPQGGTLDVS